MLDGLVEAGGTWVNVPLTLPPFITDREPRPDDHKFSLVTGGRPMVEFAHARATQGRRERSCSDFSPSDESDPGEATYADAKVDLSRSGQ